MSQIVSYSAIKSGILAAVLTLVAPGVVNLYNGHNLAQRLVGVAILAVYTLAILVAGEGAISVVPAIVVVAVIVLVAMRFALQAAKSAQALCVNN